MDSTSRWIVKVNKTRWIRR